MQKAHELATLTYYYKDPDGTPFRPILQISIENPKAGLVSSHLILDLAADIV